MIIWKDFQYTCISSNASKSDVDREMILLQVYSKKLPKSQNFSERN